MLKTNFVIRRVHCVEKRRVQTKANKKYVYEMSKTFFDDRVFSKSHNISHNTKY